MIVDSSALVAMLYREPDFEVYRSALRGNESIAISAATVLETSIVVESRGGRAMGRGLDALITTYGIEVVPFTADHLAVARTAYREFGRGSGHPAKLNLGDCFSYALATCTRRPLLFKGEDFTHTDVESALG